jgi:hypothetical protein
MVNLLAQKLGPNIRVVDHLIIVISGSQAPVPQMLQSALRPSRSKNTAKQVRTMPPPINIVAFGASSMPHQTHKGPKTVSNNMMRLTVEEGTNRAA